MQNRPELRVKARKQKTGSKLPLSGIMFGCLLDCEKLVHVLVSAEILISARGGRPALTRVPPQWDNSPMRMPTARKPGSDAGLREKTGLRGGAP